jgi:hypothetical protein
MPTLFRHHHYPCILEVLWQHFPRLVPQIASSTGIDGYLHWCKSAAMFCFWPVRFPILLLLIANLAPLAKGLYSQAVRVPTRSSLQQCLVLRHQDSPTNPTEFCPG